MATRASGYRIDPLGRYYTPAWAVDSLLNAYPEITEVPLVWDPCAGAGHILAALEARGYARNRLHASDIRPPRRRVWDGVITHKDALTMERPSWTWPAIVWITNPPYGHQGKLAADIIRRLLRIAGPSDMVAILLSNGFDSRPTRADLFGGHPNFVRRIQLTERIRWANLKQMKAGPSQAHVWCVWDRRRRGPAQVIYIGREMPDAAPSFEAGDRQAHRQPIAAE